MLNFSDFITQVLAKLKILLSSTNAHSNPKRFHYSEGPLTGPTRTGPMLLKNKIIDILKIHVKPRDQLSRTHEIYLKKFT